MPASRLSRACFVAASTVGLALAGLGATPALAAAAPATLQLHVVDADGNSVPDMYVTAISNSFERFVDFGSTDDHGNLLVTGGGHDHSDKLAAGTYELEVGDNSEARYKADGLFASVSKESVKIVAGANDLGDVVVPAGGIASGTASTPSGQPLRGLSIDVESSDQDDEGGYFGYGFDFETTFGNGSFDEPALAVGDYDISYDATDGESQGDDEGDDYDFRPAGSFTVAQPGQRVNADIAVRVAATPAATSAYGISPSAGQVELVFKIANTRYGITDPGGTVTVSTPAGTTKGSAPVTVATVKGKETGRAAVDFAATAGTRQYVVRYGNSTGDADLLNTSVRLSVKVK